MISTGGPPGLHRASIRNSRPSAALPVRGDGSVHLVAGPGALGNGSAPAGGAVPGRTHSLGSMKAFGPGRD